jgi:hypothetical protein
MNDLAILIGLISFPGLVAAIICDKVLVHTERWGTFKYMVYTFVFGVASYLALQFVAVALDAVGRRLPFLGIEPVLSMWSTLLDQSSKPQWGEIAWATSFAPVIAGFAALIVNKKWVNKAAQKLNISGKYGDENLFSYYLNSPDVTWVYVRDIGSNLSYRGLVKSFSETKEIQELVLTDVTVFDYKESDELYRVETIYLTKPIGSFIIETPESSQSRELCHDDQEGSTAGGNRSKRSEGRRDKNNQHSPAAVPTAAAAAEKEKLSAI